MGIGTVSPVSSAPCECFPQMSSATDELDAFDPAPCLDCGGVTRPGRFRCDRCQTDRRHGSERMREVLESARRSESARSHELA